MACEPGVRRVVTHLSQHAASLTYRRDIHVRHTGETTDNPASMAHEPRLCCHHSPNMRTHTIRLTHKQPLIQGCTRAVRCIAGTHAKYTRRAITHAPCAQRSHQRRKMHISFSSIILELHANRQRAFFTPVNSSSCMTSWTSST